MSDAGKVNLKTIPIKDLIPADYNPREMSSKAREGLNTSIETFGLVQPLVWNSRTGRLVGGHQRLAYLIKKGVAETDVVVVDLDEPREKALNVALNNKKIQGEFTSEIGNLLDELDDELDEEAFIGLGLDDLEHEMQKTFKTVKEIEFEGDPANDTKTETDETLGNANVKMVQLYLNEESFKEFAEIVSKLQGRYGSDNNTDTVMGALRELNENI